MSSIVQLLLHFLAPCSQPCSFVDLCAPLSAAQPWAEFAITPGLAWVLPWLSAESTIQWVWLDSFIFRFFHGTGSVYITAQRRLFLCTCLHVLVLKFLKPSALGECLHSTCEPLIDEDKSPVSESWGKHSITNWSFNEGHPWKERDGGERSCGVWEIQ